MIAAGSLFGRTLAPLLGIDISSSSVKLVELTQDKSGGLVLERCAIEPLERGWITDGNIEKFDEVAEALRRLLKKSGTKTKNVALALPSSAVITKKITLPGGMSEQELEVQVEAAGLKTTIIDIESYASRLAASRLIEALPNQGRNALVALFEVGALTTSMQVMRNDEVLYEREQAFGGAQLTQQIVRQYGFSLEEAESKKRSGDMPEDYAVAVLRPFVESLAQEIGRALQYFFTSTPHHQIDHILLAGGSAPLPGLTEAVAQQSGFACSVVNPFDGMGISGSIRMKKMAREAPSYLTSCGLAMRRFLQ